MKQIGAMRIRLMYIKNLFSMSQWQNAIGPTNQLSLAPRLSGVIYIKNVFFMIGMEQYNVNP